jgi:hypothetical protein
MEDRERERERERARERGRAGDREIPLIPPGYHATPQH